MLQLRCVLRARVAHVARRARNPQDPRIDAEDVERAGHGLIFATSIYYGQDAGGDQNIAIAMV